MGPFLSQKPTYHQGTHAHIGSFSATAPGAEMKVSPPSVDFRPGARAEKYHRHGRAEPSAVAHERAAMPRAQRAARQ